ncbi:hypothetical protein E4U41_005067 [Claviceps citrina]|nr:hypothetical protein E4U41_005067 [Claviceps citrina]
MVLLPDIRRRHHPAFVNILSDTQPLLSHLFIRHIFTKMRFSVIALAAVAGIAIAKRGCRHDRKHPGWGWYWVVEGDTLGSIGEDFGQDYHEIAKMNGIKNPDFLPAWITIYVRCV